MPGGLRTVRHCFFTGKVVTANGISMHFPVSAFFVKMCLEQPAGCDKHEINNTISLFYAQSKRGGHFKS